MKYLQVMLAAAVISLGLASAPSAVGAGEVYLPCHPNCGPVCVPGGRMKCK